VLINCDSAFVLNPSTFAAYQVQSAKAVRLNATSRELAGAYASLFNLQEARLSEQSKEFEQLSLKMDSLSRESAHSATRMIIDVEAVSRAVEKVTADLTEVQSMLEPDPQPACESGEEEKEERLWAVRDRIWDRLCAGDHCNPHLCQLKV
jgi:hypothetical protein